MFEWINELWFNFIDWLKAPIELIYTVFLGIFKVIEGVFMIVVRVAEICGTLVYIVYSFFVGMYNTITSFTQVGNTAINNPYAEGVQFMMLVMNHVGFGVLFAVISWGLYFYTGYAILRLMKR